MSENNEKILNEILVTASQLTEQECKEFLRFGQGMVVGKQNAEKRREESTGK